MDRTVENFSHWIRVLAFAFAAVMATARFSHAGADRAPPVSEAQFRALATELAPKVNLFAEIWKHDPNAEFYGGTSRDFLYWVVRQFQGVKTRKKAEEVMEKLRRFPLIDVREFILEESDVDVITATPMHSIKADDFGVRKTDYINPQILDAATEIGFNERNQGYVPVEKIRLARNGLKTFEGFTDGVTEIYSGKLTVNFAPEEAFLKTSYASQNLNHPVLLALRYLRAVASDYYQRFGTAYPVEVGMDPASADACAAVFDSIRDGKTLRPFFEKPQFTIWFNASIQKAFRSYSNPTAAFHLMKRFRLDELILVYPKIKPFFNYLFVKKWNAEAVHANFAKYGMEPSEVYSDLKEYFPNGKFYHGAGDEDAFFSILRQGVIPSRVGTAGKGLYGVDLSDVDFAKNQGGHPDRVVEFTLDARASLIDVLNGKGRELWQESKSEHHGDYERFAEMFGADIIRYPYQVKAYVMKNAGAIAAIEGYTRKLLPLSGFIAQAESVRTAEEFLRLVSLLELQQWASSELDLLAKTVPNDPELVRRVAQVFVERKAGFLNPWRNRSFKNSDVYFDREIAASLRSFSRQLQFVDQFLLRAYLEGGQPEALSALFSDPALFLTLPSFLPENAEKIEEIRMGALLGKLLDAYLAFPQGMNMSPAEKFLAGNFHQNVEQVFHRPGYGKWVDKIAEVSEEELLAEFRAAAAQKYLEPESMSKLLLLLPHLKSGPKILIRLMRESKTPGERSLLSSIIFLKWRDIPEWRDDQYFPILLEYMLNLDNEGQFHYLILHGHFEYHHYQKAPPGSKLERFEKLLNDGAFAKMGVMGSLFGYTGHNTESELKSLPDIKKVLIREFGEPDLSAFGFAPRPKAPGAGSQSIFGFCTRLLRSAH